MTALKVSGMWAESGRFLVDIETATLYNVGSAVRETRRGYQ